MPKGKFRTDLPEPDPYDLTGMRNRRGRPVTTEYDEDKIRSLAAVGCTYAEIAAQCGFSEQHLRELRKLYPGIQEAIDLGRSEMHKSLRKKQYDVAMDGSVPMLIHLGKSELGQNDKLTLAGDKDNPVTIVRLRWGDEVEDAGRDSSESDSSPS